MQQLKKRWLSSLVVFGISMAALTAPPSVFAETAPPAGTTPAPTPAPTPTPAPALPPVPAQVVGAVRVGLDWGLTTADITAPGGLYLIGDGVMQAQLPAGQVVKVTLDAGLIAVSGQTKKFTTVRLVPVPPPAPVPAPAPAPAVPEAPPAKPVNPVTYKGKTYRGEIHAVIGPVSKKLSVVNVVNLDEYLLGVVPEEVEATWPVESVKAQAVAARTYALANNKWVGDGFSLRWTTDDQYYIGMASEKAASNLAVWATRGQVLTFDGRLISAMYHSSSGGYTENNEIIYASTPVGYLRGVKDYDNVDGNRYYSWEKPLTIDEFTAFLKKWGHDVGTVTAVSPAGTKGVSDRWSHWLVTGSAGSKTLSGKQVRDALSLASNPKTVTVQTGGLSPAVKSYTQAQTFVALGAGGTVTQRTAAGTAVVAAGKSSALVAGAVTAMGAKISQPAGVVVAGGGHGHAVGMSQWGALGMAKLGKTYLEILTHYYTGTKLETRQTQ